MSKSLGFTGYFDLALELQQNAAMYSKRLKRNSCAPGKRIFGFVFVVMALAGGFGGLGLQTTSAISDDNVTHEIAGSTRTPTVRQNHVATGHSTKGRTWIDFQSLFILIRSIHPVVIATGQVLAVVGLCLLMTDNRELELYLKIDFRPPKVDILN